MNSSDQRTRSVWMAELPKSAPELTHDLKVDVAIAGAGIAGVTTAYLLAKAGITVALIDMGPPGGGMTSRSSAHITAIADDHWATIARRRGDNAARLAAGEQRQAIDRIEAIQSAEGIACDFARVDGFLVLGKGGTEALLKRERTAAHKAGFLDVELDRDRLQEFFTGPALRFPRQARFHPLKYLKGLIACIERLGGIIVTGRVTSMTGGRAAHLEVEGGHVIKARALVAATNFPLNDKHLIKKQSVFRSYVIGGHIPRGAAPDALIFDTEVPYHYARIQPDGARDILLLGGEDHKTGKAADMEARFSRLEKWGRKHFPALGPVTWRWSGQVVQSADSLPFLGHLPGKDKNVFVIAGDSGQGIINSTIGASMILDALQKRSNPCTSVFNPGRRAKEPERKLEHAPAKRPKHVTRIADIPPGSGAVIVRGGEKIAVYRMKDNALIERCAKCPHMGLSGCLEPGGRMLGLSVSRIAICAGRNAAARPRNVRSKPGAS